jgi:biotin carboxylase
MKAKLELENMGLSVVGPTNHDDFITSIYFFDPSGHRLELTARTCHDPVRLQQFVTEAPELLALWDKTHDWSQRHTVFGAATGYKRAEV